MARHGLILWENEATGSSKVSKYFLGLWDAMFFHIKNASRNKHIPKSTVFRIFTYSRYTATAAAMLTIPTAVDAMEELGADVNNLVSSFALQSTV